MAIRLAVENLPPAASLFLVILVGIVLLGIIVRPYGTRPWQWSLGGALVLWAGGAFRGAGVGAVAAALWEARDVGLFLVGIITIAAVARQARLFDAAAERLLALSGGYRGRLLLLTFGFGVLCTAVLSNDTTVVALTPAVITLALALKEDPAPYTYACALVASAASFLLPIANPANLLLYGSALPGLMEWLRTFGPASLGALAVTFIVLRLIFARSLRGRSETQLDLAVLTPAERAVGIAVALAIVLLLLATLLHRPPGAAAFLGGAIVLGVGLIARCYTLEDARSINLSVLPFVAGLLAILVAVERSHALVTLHRRLLDASAHGVAGSWFAASVVAIASALANNLPIAALVARIATPDLAAGMHRALVIAVDLGPNFAMSGSLATLLWAQSLKEHGIKIRARDFARVGIACTLPAFVVALLLAR